MRHCRSCVAGWSGTSPSTPTSGLTSRWAIGRRRQSTRRPHRAASLGDGAGTPPFDDQLWGLAMTDVTRILSEIGHGDPRAAERLLPLVYDELRKLAARRLAHEKPGQTLQATALVHEAYLR